MTAPADDWAPIGTTRRQASASDDWKLAKPQATPPPSNDWGSAPLEVTAQHWAKQYGASPVPDAMNPQLGAMIDRAAEKYGVNSRFARIIAGIESAGGRVTGSSSAGARGVFQLMPGTFKGLGGTNIDDPEQNIDAGVRYLAQLSKRFKGDLYKTAMAYNMGPAGLESALSQGDYAALPSETREYAAKLYVSMQAPQTLYAQARAPETKAATAGAVHGIQQAGVGEGALHAARAVAGEHGVVDNTIRWLKNEGFKAAQVPMQAVDAVLGAPQRLVEGMVTGQPGHRIAHGVDLAAHPRNAELQNTALDHLIHTLRMPPQKGKDLKSKLLRLGETFGVQTVTDPLTYIPYAGEVWRGVKGVEALDKVYHAAKDMGVAIPAVRQLLNAGRTLTRSAVSNGMKQMTDLAHEVLARRPELDKFLDENGKAARLSIEQRNRTKEAAQAAQDEQLLAQHAADLRKLRAGQPLPPAIRQRYLQEPYRYGTPEMRNEALRLGYKPTAQDLHEFPQPTGALRYNVREDYQTMITLRGNRAWEDMPIFRGVGGKHKEEFGGFEKQRRTEGALPVDQFDLTKNRLALGRARVRQMQTDQETEQYLRANGGWHGPRSVDVTQLSHTPKRFAPDSPLRLATRVQKTAISVNPLPHGLKNVGMLAYLKGGPEAFGKGLAYASKGLTQAQRDRLVNMGVDAEYVRDLEGPLKALGKHVPVVEKYHRASEAVMTRLEMGYRQALLDQLDRKLGKSAAGTPLEYRKAQIIRNALGDYRNNSAFVAGLDAIGGPFVAFRLGIVPGAVGRALVHNPGHVEQIARAEQDVNNRQHGVAPQGTDFHFGGPVEDSANMATNLPKYIMSPASLGPILGLGAQWLTPDRPLTAGDVRDELGRTFVPGYGIAEEAGLPQDILGGGYSGAPGVSQWESGLAAMLGAYFAKHPLNRAAQKFHRTENRAH